MGDWGKPKHTINVCVDQDDYEWASKIGFPFSKCFREYLSMIRREIESASWKTTCGD